jgi:hypothetical protein
MNRNLNAYKATNVRGLYTYYHFEAPCGSFVQVSHSGTYVVHQDAETGIRTEYNSVEELKAEWEHEENLIWREHDDFGPASWAEE